jgi:hypothetical protein
MLRKLWLTGKNQTGKLKGLPFGEENLSLFLLTPEEIFSDSGFELSLCIFATLL